MPYHFQGNALGPVWMPNFMMVVQTKDTETYQLQIYPDYFNNELRAAGKPMHFYYKPDAPRMAQNGNGSYKFSFIDFEGVLTADDNIDSPGAQTELAGGVLAFTSTFKIPDDVIAAALQQLKDNCLNDAKFSTDSRWRRTDGLPDPELGVVPIVSDLCAVSNLGNAGATKPATGDDPWLCQVEGTNYDTSIKDDKGNVIATGTTNPVGENAYTIMLGQYPAAILKQAFKGVSSPIYVTNRLQHCFYMDAFHAEIHADFKMVYTYFSAQVKAKYFWAQADLQAAFSDLQKQGGLTYSVTMNGMILTADQQKTYQAQTDKVYEKIQDWLSQTMLTVTPAKPDPAKAADTGGGGLLGLLTGGAGVSVAMKFEHDVVNEDMNFSEDISETYLEYNIIQADLAGLATVMGSDAGNVAKYFQTVHLDEAFRKVHVVASARAYWPSTDGKTGDPINQIDLEISYPDSTGAYVTKISGLYMKDLSSAKSGDLKPIIWQPNNQNYFFVVDFARNDGSNDDANKIKIKRSIYYNEDPRVEVESPLVLEEETTDHTIVASADTLGTLRVGPIRLDTDLPSNKVQVSVTITKDNRDPETMVFNVDNMKLDQSYLSITSNADGAIPWSYQVEVVVKGTFPKPSLRWTGPLIKKTGSMPLIVSVPDVPANLADQVAAYLS